MFQAGQGFGAQSGAISFGSAQASYSDQTLTITLT